jgi:hypothetical protein
MQQLKWIFLIVVSLSLGTVSLQAQETLKEGTIKYEITDAGSDNPQIQQQMQMMKGSTMTVFIMGKTQLTKMNMMNGMYQQRMLMNKEEDKMEMYMDMMGRKIKTVMDLSKQEDEMGDVETNIEYFPEETKEIAGYTAYKAVIKNNVGEQEIELTTYITEDLKFDAEVIRNVQGAEELKGLPLEYTVSQPQVTMTFTAQDISKEVDPAEFDFDKSGYDEMSPEELQQMGGGGMGGF